MRSLSGLKARPEAAELALKLKKKKRWDEAIPEVRAGPPAVRGLPDEEQPHVSQPDALIHDTGAPGEDAPEAGSSPEDDAEAAPSPGGESSAGGPAEDGSGASSPADDGAVDSSPAAERQAEPEAEPEAEAAPSAGAVSQGPDKASSGALGAGIGSLAAGLGLGVGTLAAGVEQSRLLTDYYDGGTPQDAFPALVQELEQTRTAVTVLGIAAGVAAAVGAVLVPVAAKGASRSRVAVIVPAVAPGSMGLLVAGRW